MKKYLNIFSILLTFLLFSCDFEDKNQKLKMEQEKKRETERQKEHERYERIKREEKERIEREQREIKEIIEREREQKELDKRIEKKRDEVIKLRNEANNYTYHNSIRVQECNKRDICNAYKKYEKLKNYDDKYRSRYYNNFLTSKEEIKDLTEIKEYLLKIIPELEREKKENEERYEKQEREREEKKRQAQLESERKEKERQEQLESERKEKERAREERIERERIERERIAKEWERGIEREIEREIEEMEKNNRENKITGAEREKIKKGIKRKKCESIISDFCRT